MQISFQTRTYGISGMTAWPASTAASGILYRARGERDRAEELHKKSLAKRDAAVVFSIPATVSKNDWVCSEASKSVEFNPTVG